MGKEPLYILNHLIINTIEILNTHYLILYSRKILPSLHFEKKLFSKNVESQNYPLT
jgi:hypothetical protein